MAAAGGQDSDDTATTIVATGAAQSLLKVVP